MRITRKAKKREELSRNTSQNGTRNRRVAFPPNYLAYDQRGKARPALKNKIMKRTEKTAEEKNIDAFSENRKQIRCLSEAYFCGLDGGLRVLEARNNRNAKRILHRLPSFASIRNNTIFSLIGFSRVCATVVVRRCEKAGV